MGGLIIGGLLGGSAVGGGLLVGFGLGDLRGMLIFKLESVEEARKLMDADPTLKAGRLTLDLHPWFAAAGLRVNPPKSAP